jgi:hypothetical protein
MRENPELVMGNPVTSFRKVFPKMATLDPAKILTRSLDLQTSLAEFGYEDSDCKKVIYEYIVQLEKEECSIFPEFDAGTANLGMQILK